MNSRSEQEALATYVTVTMSRDRYRTTGSIRSATGVLVPRRRWNKYSNKQQDAPHYMHCCMRGMHMPIQDRMRRLQNPRFAEFFQARWQANIAHPHSWNVQYYYWNIPAPVARSLFDHLSPCPSSAFLVIKQYEQRRPALYK